MHNAIEQRILDLLGSKGETLTEENLAVKRSPAGIGADRWDDVCGRQAGRDYQTDEAIEI